MTQNQIDNIYQKLSDIQESIRDNTKTLSRQEESIKNIRDHLKEINSTIEKHNKKINKLERQSDDAAEHRQNIKDQKEGIKWTVLKFIGWAGAIIAALLIEYLVGIIGL